MSDRSHFEEPFRDPLFEWYVSVATDFIHKAAAATVLFFYLLAMGSIFMSSLLLVAEE